MKRYELIRLIRLSDCYYKARLFDTELNRYTEKTFLYYTKKEVISILRNKYDCIVSCNYAYER